MATKTTQTALDAYMAAHAEALALIERMQVAIENHDISPDPDALNWGHVGDIVETRRQLQAISDRLFSEGEYAPEAK